MPCDLPFYPNANYVNEAEHDANTRKYYYLVLDHGLFTKKADADPLCDADDIHIFFTRKQAQREWDRDCAERHDHDKAPSNRDSAGAISSRAPTSRRTTPRAMTRATPSARATSNRVVGAGKRSGARSTSVKPGPKSRPLTKAVPLYEDDSDDGAAAPKPKSRSPTKTVPLYEDDSDDGAAAPKLKSRSVTRTAPLYGEDSDDGMAAAVRPKVEAADVPVAPALILGEREGAAMEPVPISPTISSASSISTTSLTTTANSGTGRQLAPQSISGLFRARTAWASSIPPAASAAHTPSKRLLYNSTTRTLYKDAAKAVREMGQTDTVQVVECEDVIGYCAGHTGSMAG